MAAGADFDADIFCSTVNLRGGRRRDQTDEKHHDRRGRYSYQNGVVHEITDFTIRWREMVIA